jgi:hypothetical protein
MNTTEKKLLKETEEELCWTEDDDDGFKKFKSFNSLLKLKSSNTVKYLDSIENNYLLDMYKYKFNIAWRNYQTLLDMNPDNVKYQSKIRKLDKMVELIA